MVKEVVVDTLGTEDGSDIKKPQINTDVIVDTQGPES